MKIHFVDLVTQYQKIQPEIDEAILRVVRSGQYILGREVQEFEASIADYLKVNYAIGCASGTDALQIAMMAMGIGDGDEVITSPFSFVATAETILLLGAKPIFVDINEKTYNIDADKIEQAITPRTKAIIPVHLYGQAVDMDPIMEIAKQHRLKVIEDTAQAIGAEYKGKKVGTFGNAGCISFYPSKNLGAYGDAGLVVTNETLLAEHARMITIHGSKRKYQHEILGINSRLDTIQAAILNVKLKYLDQWTQARQSFAFQYDEALKAMNVITPYVAPDRTHIYHLYSIRVFSQSGKTRDGLAQHLNANGIPTAIHYPIPLHLQTAFRHLGYSEGDFPVAERVAKEILSLPMHTELNEQQITYITESIKEYVGVRLMRTIRSL